MHGIEEAYKQLKEDYHREHVSVITHTRGLKPERLLQIQRPYEPEEIQVYRNNIYKPVTMYAFIKFNDDLLRIVKESKIRLNISESLNEIQRRKNYFGKSLFDAYFSDVAPFVLEDPNGAIWFKPEFISENQEPILTFEKIPSADIKKRLPWVFQFWIIPEKEYIEVDFEKVIRVYLLDNGSWEQEELFVHNLGMLPVQYCEGITVLNEYGDPYNKSFLSPMVAWGDSIIMQESDYQATRILCGSPIREVMEMPCTNRGCNKGQIYDSESQKHIVCGTCNGKGAFIPSGAFSYIIRKKGNAALGEETKDTPALRYITLPPDILKEQRESLKESYEGLDKSFSQVFTQAAQSAIAKREDRQQKQSMLDKIGTTLMKMYEKSLITLQGYLLRGDTSPVEVVIPQTFAEISEESLKDSLTELRQGGTPQIVLDSAVKEWIKKRFGGDTQAEKLVSVLELLDPFYTYTFEEKQNLLLSGRALADEIQRSDRYIFLIKMIMREDINDMSIEQIAQRVEELYLSRYPQVSPIRNNNGEI